MWPTSVVVITFALHAKGREFEPHVDQFFLFVVFQSQTHQPITDYQVPTTTDYPFLPEDM